MSKNNINANSDCPLTDNKEIKTERLSNYETYDDLNSDLELILSPGINESEYDFTNCVCPRYVDDVYSLGINLHYYVSRIYLKLSNLFQGTRKSQFKNLAIIEIKGKKQIQKLAKYNYDQLLTYFYANGGPIIESPVSEKKRNELSPAFDQIITSLATRLKIAVDKATNSQMTAKELEKFINKNIIASYAQISRLYDNEEIQKAFTELITIRKDNADKSIA